MDSLAFLSDMNYCPSNFFHCGRLYNLKVRSILLRSKSVDESIYLAFFIEKQLVTFFFDKALLFLLWNCRIRNQRLVKPVYLSFSISDSYFSFNCSFMLL